jgi:hypothetical protein
MPYFFPSKEDVQPDIREFVRQLAESPSPELFAATVATEVRESEKAYQLLSDKLEEELSARLRATDERRRCVLAHAKDQAVDREKRKRRGMVPGSVWVGKSKTHEDPAKKSIDRWERVDPSTALARYAVAQLTTQQLTGVER